jgi:hypothetical protein
MPCMRCFGCRPPKEDYCGNDNPETYYLGAGLWWEERHGRGNRGNGATTVRLMYTFNGKVVAQREVHPDQPAVPSGSTLKGDYYHDDTMSNFFLTRYETGAVAFDASDPTPWPNLPSGSSGGDGFSVEWSGYITASTAPTGTGLYSFSTVSEGGVRLWVNGALVIDNWAPHTLSTDTGVMTTTMTAGQAYPIRVQYRLSENQLCGFCGSINKVSVQCALPTLRACWR